MSYCAIGIEHGKMVENVGTLWRSADLLGAAYIFTIGARYRRQPSDTMHSWKNIPLFHYKDLDDFIAHNPHDCLLVGVELSADAVPIHKFSHPKRAIYLLGAEDHGLSAKAQDLCHQLVQLPGRRSLNVATAGSIILYDRLKEATK